MNSITKRWIKGSLLIILMLLTVAEFFLMAAFRNSYYSAAQTALTNRINTMEGTLTATGNMKPEEKQQLLFHLTGEFAEKESFEFMLLDDEGNILATSSGFNPAGTQHKADFGKAINSDEAIHIDTYKSQLGEKIMSATYLLSEEAGQVCGVRIVTSLNRVDEELYLIFALAIIAAVAIISFSTMSGMYFVRSIVNPIQSIRDTADKIAQGQFNVRIDDGEYNDEIGQLCASINHMAHELGRNDELKNEFISSVSHELRTPLTAIKGWAETMDNTEDIATMKKGTEIILTEAERLYSMVENLLDFSRLQNSALILTKEKLDIVAEVYEAVIMYTPQANSMGIALKFDEPDEFIPVIADKSRIKQVMINLLDNALKYSSENSVIEVNIFNDTAQGYVTVEIKDYGKGIHPDDIKKVKQKFYKGKGAKRGSGIGLALVTEIVGLHGGTFDIDSEYGKYTSMRFTLKTVRTAKGN